MKLKTLILLYIILFSCIHINAQYKTESFLPSITSLRVHVNGENFSEPVIELNSDEEIFITFDQLETPIRNYYYSVEHCDINWNTSSISPMEWGDGFNENGITQAGTSMNTTVSYSHYELTLPNDDLDFKYSGNYCVKFYDIDDPDNIIATACFSIVESLVGIESKVRSDTEFGLNNKFQQLEFDLQTGSVQIENPSSDIYVTVKQNERTDNERKNLQPTYIGQGKLSFKNNRALIFEAGNEYFSFDMSSEYSFSGCINTIKFFDPYYHVDLYPDKLEPFSTYKFEKDINGRYVVNIQEYDNDETDADYYMVHFSLPASGPFFDGNVYILGGFNNNLLNNRVKMAYNNERKQYEQNILLKQGAYNYQLLFVPKNNTQGSQQRISGNHWQTENEYSIFVYYKPFGARYDRLVGVNILQSGN